MFGEVVTGIGGCVSSSFEQEINDTANIVTNTYFVINLFISLYFIIL